MRDYSHLDREDLEMRLDVAEDVCALLSWTAMQSKSDRDKALHELWRAWMDAGGDPSREGNPHLTDALISALAERRDQIRAATLARTASRP